jgi:hypothetical protein
MKRFTVSTYDMTPCKPPGRVFSAMQFTAKMKRGRRMQIAGPHFLDGHRHPWLHREINSKPESPHDEPKNRRPFPRLNIPESARGRASRMARVVRGQWVMVESGGTTMVVFFAGGDGLLLLKEMQPARVRTNVSTSRERNAFGQWLTRPDAIAGHRIHIPRTTFQSLGAGEMLGADVK